MSYKNSVKLLTTNFSVVWKQLLYMLITISLCALITWGVSSPVVDVLKQEGVIAECGAIFETIYTAPSQIINALSTAFLHLLKVITYNFSHIWFNIICTFLSAVVLYNMLKNISIYNLSSIMYMRLTSYVEIGYTRNMISNIWPSIRYAFAKMICSIPFAAIKALILYSYFNLVNSTLSIIIGLFVVVLLLVVISSLELTLFSGMAGKMLDKNNNISAFKAFFLGCAVILKKFFRVFSNSIIVVLTLILVNVFLGIFTLGVALLITIPASMLFVCLFYLTTYFGAKGDRYYITESILANPIKDSEKINE